VIRPRQRERRETLAYWPVEDMEKGEAVGLVTNLSEDGIQIHSKHDFRKGQVLTIRIAVDARLSGTNQICLVVENVWCRTSGLKTLYHAGFKIVDISEAATRGLRNLLAAFSYPAPGGRTRAEE